MFVNDLLIKVIIECYQNFKWHLEVLHRNTQNILHIHTQNIRTQFCVSTKLFLFKSKVYGETSILNAALYCLLS